MNALAKCRAALEAVLDAESDLPQAIIDQVSEAEIVARAAMVTS
jgi:hypothetical protein